MAGYQSFAAILLLGSLIFTGCSQKPPARLDAYLGVAGQGERSAPAVQVQAQRGAGPLNVGLLLLNDTSAKDLAPALSDKAKAFLADQVRKRVEAATPLRVDKVLTVADPSNIPNKPAMVQLGREQAVSHVLVALFSSMESVVPVYLSIMGDPEQGGGRGDVLGIETVNYALAELALIDVTSTQVMARSDGRAWSRLNELNVPIKSNSYPVIHRSLRNAPIYPPEEDAKDILRSIAGDEALEQAVAKLGEAWSKS
ncbi:hypothetical protein [Petrachloros mirabilis]